MAGYRSRLETSIAKLSFPLNRQFRRQTRNDTSTVEQDRNFGGKAVLYVYALRMAIASLQDLYDCECIFVWPSELKLIKSVTCEVCFVLNTISCLKHDLQILYSLVALFSYSLLKNQKIPCNKKDLKKSVKKL